MVLFDVVFDTVLDFLDLLRGDIAVLQRSLQQVQLALVPLVSLGRLFELCYPFGFRIVRLLALLHGGVHDLHVSLDLLHLLFQLLVHVLQELHHLHPFAVLWVDLRC